MVSILWSSKTHTHTHNFNIHSKHPSTAKMRKIVARQPIQNIPQQKNRNFYSNNINFFPGCAAVLHFTQIQCGIFFQSISFNLLLLLFFFDRHTDFYRNSHIKNMDLFLHLDVTATATALYTVDVVCRFTFSHAQSYILFIFLFLRYWKSTDETWTHCTFDSVARDETNCNKIENIHKTKIKWFYWISMKWWFFFFTFFLLVWLVYQNFLHSLK